MSIKSLIDNLINKHGGYTVATIAVIAFFTARNIFKDQEQIAKANVVYAYDTAVTATTTSNIDSLKNQLLQDVYTIALNPALVINNLEAVKSELNTYTTKLQAIADEKAAGRINDATINYYLMTIAAEIAQKLNIETKYGGATTTVGDFDDYAYRYGIPYPYYYPGGGNNQGSSGGGGISIGPGGIQIGGGNSGGGLLGGLLGGIFGGGSGNNNDYDSYYPYYPTTGGYDPYGYGGNQNYDQAYQQYLQYLSQVQNQYQGQYGYPSYGYSYGYGYQQPNMQPINPIQNYNYYPQYGMSSPYGYAPAGNYYQGYTTQFGGTPTAMQIA